MERWKIMLKVVLFFGLLLTILGIVTAFKNVEGFQSTPQQYPSGTNLTNGVKKSWNANTCVGPTGATGTNRPLPNNIGTPDCPILTPVPPESQIEQTGYDNYEIYNLDTPPPPVTTNLQMFNSSGSLTGIDAGAPIPWDIDNKTLDPKTVLWGTIHPNTSQDIFKVAYMRMLFGSANNFEFNDSTQQFEYASAQFNGFVLHDQAWYPTLQYAEFLADYTTENIVEGIIDGLFQNEAINKMNEISSYVIKTAEDPTHRLPEVELVLNDLEEKNPGIRDALSNRMTIAGEVTNVTENVLSERDAKTLSKLVNREEGASKVPTYFEKKMRAVRGYPAKRAALAQKLQDLQKAQADALRKGDTAAAALNASKIEMVQNELPSTFSNLERYNLAQSVRKQALLKAGNLQKEAKLLQMEGKIAEAALKEAQAGAEVLEAESVFKNAIKDISVFSRISGSVAKALSVLDSLLTPVRFIETKMIKALEVVFVKTPAKITSSILKLVGVKNAEKLMKSFAQKLGNKFVVNIIRVMLGAAVLEASPIFEWLGFILDIYCIVLIAIVPAIFNAFIPSDAICPEGYPFNIETATQEGSSAGVVGWNIISNLPIIGDSLSVFGPYICSTNDLTGSEVKIPYRPPPYYFDSTLSLFCDMNKAPINPDHPAFNDKRQYYELANGYNILADTNNTIFPDNRPTGERLTEPPIWVDFSHPDMLDKMADFYYTKSRQFAQTNYDGTATFEYISKFYGLIASSRYSCDVQCEITSVTYYPFTGIEQSRTIVPVPEGSPTTYHDRRFYFFVDKTLDGLKDGIRYLSGLDRVRYAQDATEEHLDLLMIDNMNRYIVSACTNTDGTGPNAQEVTEEGGYIGDALISLGDPGIKNYHQPVVVQLQSGGTAQTQLPDATNCDFVNGKLGKISKRASLPELLPPKIGSPGISPEGILITKDETPIIWGSDNTSRGSVFAQGGSTKIYNVVGTKPSIGGEVFNAFSAMVTGYAPLGFGLAGGLAATTYNALPVYQGSSAYSAFNCLTNDIAKETGTYVINGTVLTNQPAATTAANLPSGWLIQRGPTIEYAPGYTPHVGNPKNLRAPWNKCNGINIIQQDCTSRFSVRRAVNAFNNVYGTNQRIKKIHDIEVRQITDMNSAPMCVYTCDIINLDNTGGEVGTATTQTFAINHEIQAGDDTCTYVPIGCNRSNPFLGSSYSSYNNANRYNNTFITDSSVIPIYEPLPSINYNKKVPTNLLVTPGDGVDYGPSLNALAFLNGCAPSQIIDRAGTYDGNPCKYIQESMRNQFNTTHGVNTNTGYSVSIANSTDMLGAYTPDADKFRKSVANTANADLVGQCVYIANVTQTFPPQNVLTGSTGSTGPTLSPIGPSMAILSGVVITMGVKMDPTTRCRYILATDDYDEISSSLKANPNPNPNAFKLDTCKNNSSGTYDSCSDPEIQTRIVSQFNAYYGNGQVDDQPIITNVYAAYTPDAATLLNGAQCIFDCQITTNNGVDNTIDRRTITMELTPTIVDPTTPSGGCFYDYSSDNYPKSLIRSKVPKGSTWFDVPSEPPRQNTGFLRTGCTDAEAQRVSGYAYAHASDYRDCSGSYVMRNLVNQFNTHYSDTKILSVSRASSPQTPGGNVLCDYEVQMLRTFGAKQNNVTEKETVRLYLKPSSKNQCDYDVDFTITTSNPNTGISITTDSSIDQLGSPYVWSTKLIDWVKHGINNALLNFQNIQPANVVRTEALNAKVAVDNLYNTVKSLSGVAGTTITCRETNILQKIVNRWNYDNMPNYPDLSGQYGLSQTMVAQIRKAEPNSSHTGCVVELVEQTVNYEDYLDNYINDPNAIGEKVFENPSTYLRQYNFELTLQPDGNFTVNPFTKENIANRTMDVLQGDHQNGYLSSSISNIDPTVSNSVVNRSVGIQFNSQMALAYVKYLYENTPVGRIPGAPANNTITQWLKWFSPRPDVCEYQVYTRRYMLDNSWGTSGTWKQLSNINANDYTYITAYWTGYSVDSSANPSTCPTLNEFHPADYTLSTPDFSSGGVVVKAISKKDNSVYTTPQGGTQLPYLVFQNANSMARVNLFGDGGQSSGIASGGAADSLPSGVTMSANSCSV